MAIFNNLSPRACVDVLAMLYGIKYMTYNKNLPFLILFLIASLDILAMNTQDKEYLSSGKKQITGPFFEQEKFFTLNCYGGQITNVSYHTLATFPAFKELVNTLANNAEKYSQINIGDIHCQILEPILRHMATFADRLQVQTHITEAQENRLIAELFENLKSDNQIITKDNILFFINTAHYLKNKILLKALNCLFDYLHERANKYNLSWVNLTQENSAPISISEQELNQEHFFFSSPGVENPENQETYNIPTQKNNKVLTLVCLDAEIPHVRYEDLSSSLLKSAVAQLGGIEAIEENAKISLTKFHSRIVQILLNHMSVEAKLTKNPFDEEQVIDVLLNNLLEDREINEKNFHYVSTAAAAFGCKFLSKALKKIIEVKDFDREPIEESSTKKKKSNSNLKRKKDSRSSEGEPPKKVAKTKKDLSPSSKPYSCDHEGCDKSYDQRKKLDRHKITHGPKEFICDEPNCGEKFHFANRLKRHHDSVHSRKRPYKCDYEGCEASFPSQAVLTQHKKNHTSENEVDCDICHITFSCPGSLSRHIRVVHDKEKHFACTYPGCPYVAASNTDLNTHLGYEHFQCPYANCDVILPQRFLAAHKKKVHNEKESLQCTHQGCPYVAASKSALTQHINFPHITCTVPGCIYSNTKRQFDKHTTNEHAQNNR